jgi:hypothetical protein
MNISLRHTRIRCKGRLAAIGAWSWIIVSIIVSALLRRRDRAARRREDPPMTVTPRASSQRPEPAALLREPGRRSRIETAAAWTQVVALPLAVALLIYAGLAYSRQAEDAQQALAAIRVQQQSLAAQQRTVDVLQRQIQTAMLSVEAQRELIVGVRSARCYRESSRGAASCTGRKHALGFPSPAVRLYGLDG